MEELISYLLKASLGFALFYGIYWFSFRKETLFKVTRIFLIVSLLASVVIPFIELKFINKVYTVDTTNLFVELNKNFQTITTVATPKESMDSSLNWHTGLLLVYLTGVTIFLLRLVIQSADLMVVILKNKIRRVSNLKVVENEKYGLPFSFFNIVFINPKFHNGTDLTNILAHEKVHIRENHWFDLFLVEILTVIFWFNPFVWLFERSIKQNHEYLADEGVLAQGFTIGRYQAILINQIMGMQIIGLTNNLNYSLNKKRMNMMTKMKTPKTRAFRMIWTLPAIAILLVAFAKPSYEIAPNSNIELVKSTIQEVRNIKLQGKVFDEKGTPLEGASIIIGGTSIGTISDKDGSFTISTAKTDKVYISYIGYTTIVEDLSSVKQHENTNEFYSIYIKMKIGVINLELDQMLKEKPLSNTNEEGSSSKNSDKEEFFVVVEKLADYPGGMYALANEIKEKTDKLNLSGKVEVGLTVDEKGSNTAIYIIGNVDKKVQEDLVKFFLELKKWNPGMQRGKAVPVNYKITINK